jgi:UDP-N-acetylglucosamine--N-acetylmuramyl-(pentapeptide) pyrophosphoryl-undecaprenol N-acetylglucosamine transferase
LDLNGKRILFAAGGTGGHVNPALAAAGYIREHWPEAEILFVGTPDKIEARLVPAAGFAFKTIKIDGFLRKLSLRSIRRNLSVLSALPASYIKAGQILKDFRPDVVVGMGGYVTGPVLRKAVRMGIPVAIHEQNAYPGVANKAVAPKAGAIMLTVEKAAEHMKFKTPPVLTGLPVRMDLLTADREKSREELGLGDRPLILSMGGSLGARAINAAVAEMIVLKHESNCVFMHATGSKGLWVKDVLREKGINLSNESNVIIREYIDDMARCMSAADVVISRAGAGTLSEIQALGKVSILIPSPNVAENHQFHNAMALVSKGAALMIEEKDLTGKILSEKVFALLEDKALSKSIGENAARLSIPDSAARIAECIGRLASGQKNNFLRS